MFTIHRLSSLPYLNEFGSGVNRRTRNNLYVHEVLGLYIFVSRSFSFINSSKFEWNINQSIFIS